MAQGLAGYPGSLPLTHLRRQTHRVVQFNMLAIPRKNITAARIVRTLDEGFLLLDEYGLVVVANPLAGQPSGVSRTALYP